MTMLNLSELMTGNIHFRDRDIMAPTRRLSSALRINGAADDPSGIGLVARLKGTELGLLKSIENTLDGISMLQTIDGYLSEMSDMVSRIRDLAIRAANDAVLRDDCRDREKLNNEAQQLINEIEREAQIGYFNLKPVLQGDLLANVKVKPDSDVAIASATGMASNPSWVDGDTIVYTDLVSTTGLQAGARPGPAGTSSYRVFTQDINPSTNATVGAPVKVTRDPSALSDEVPVHDFYFDRAGGGINDPRPNNILYPILDLDDDADGYRVTADDDPADNSETGPGLGIAGTLFGVTPGAQETINSTYSSDRDLGQVTWNNTITKTFTESTIDKVTVNVPVGEHYQIQIFDRDPLSGTVGQWIDAANGSNNGIGADDTIVFGQDYISDSIRLVIDDPEVFKTTGASISPSIRNDVTLDAVQIDTAQPKTVRYNTAVPGNVDTITLTFDTDVTFDVYYDDGAPGTDPVKINGAPLSATAGVEEKINTGLLVNPGSFFVEYSDSTANLTAFRPYLDTDVALNGQGASAEPLTVKYSVTGGPANIDTIKVNVAGANYEVYADDGAPDPDKFVNSTAGSGTLDPHAALVNGGTTYYIDMDNAAGAVNEFYAEDGIFNIGGAAMAPSADRTTIKYTIAGAPLVIDEIYVDSSDVHDIYVDSDTPLATGAAAGGVSHAYFAPGGAAATDIYVEMANPAGTLNNPIDVYFGGGLPLDSGWGAPVDHVYEYNFASSDLSHLEVTTTAGTGYTLEVYDSGAALIKTCNGSGAGGTEEFNFAAVSDATKIKMILDIDKTDADITSIYAADRQTLGVQAAATRSWTRTFSGGVPTDFNYVDVTIDNGDKFWIYDGANNLISPAGGLTGSQTVSVGAQNSDAVRIEVEVGSTANVTIDGVRYETEPGVGAESDASRFLFYDLQAVPPGGLLVNRMSIEFDTAGINYRISNDAGTQVAPAVGWRTSTGATENITPTSSNTTFLALELEVGADMSNIATDLTAWSILPLTDQPDSFVDLNDDNDNIAVFTFDAYPEPNNVYERFDRLDLTVKNGHNYSVEYYDSSISDWVRIMNNQTGNGGVQTYLVENDPTQLTDIDTDKIRVILHSGNDTENNEVVINSIVNRLDRDGDNFPDIIEDTFGSNSNNFNSLPFGASRTVGGVVPGPDDDGDGFLDYKTYYDTYDDVASPPAGVVDIQNPYGFSWQNGTGNNLFTFSGKQLDPEDVPTTDDADNDTIPDPLDPFEDVAEFTTWVDGAAAYRNGMVLFISNRSTPDPLNPPEQDVYWLMGGTYSLASPPSSGAADNPVLNGNGTAGAWDEAGVISGFMATGESCDVAAGVTTFTGIAGSNPAFNDDTTEIVFEDGSGELAFAKIPNGEATRPDYNIQGYDPDWSGDNILYTTDPAGGDILVYNVVTKRSYLTGLTGMNATWQPGGTPEETKVAYEKPDGTIHVATLELTYEPNYIQVGADNEENNRVSISYPDARSKKLGVGYIRMDTQQGALDAIPACDTALKNISDYRAEVGQAERILRHTLDDLHQQHVNMAAARSNIEDADMAAEYTDLARMQILQNSAYATSAQASKILEQDKMGSIREGVGIASISRFLA